MIQMIYKELMLMGLVSFTVIMIEASKKEDPNHHDDWIVGIDFSHIVIFFLTFFFVIHAFYLMWTSVSCASTYRKMFSEKRSELISSISDMKDQPLIRYLFQFNYLPLSNLRDRVEFNLAIAIFRDTYWLPDDFNYSSYISSCFDRYALKTINRSVFTWFVLALLGVANYLRIINGSIGTQGCKEAFAAESSHRRLSETSATDAIDTSSHSSGTITVNDCLIENVRLFLFTAVGLLAYTLLMVVFTRIYQLRLLSRIGFNGPEDYQDFLNFAEQESKNAVSASTEARVTISSLRIDIERVLDASEHSGGDDEFKEIGEFILATYRNLKDLVDDVFLKIKVLCIRIINPARVTIRQGSVSLLESETVDVESAAALSSRSVVPNAPALETHFEESATRAATTGRNSIFNAVSRAQFDSPVGRKTMVGTLVHTTDHRPPSSSSNESQPLSNSNITATHESNHLNLNITINTTSTHHSSRNQSYPNTNPHVTESHKTPVTPTAPVPHRSRAHRQSLQQQHGDPGQPKQAHFTREDLLQRLSSRLHQKAPSNKHHKKHAHHSHHSHRSRTSSDNFNEPLANENPPAQSQLQKQEPVPTHVPHNLPPIEGVDSHALHVVPHTHHHHQTHVQTKHAPEVTNSITNTNSVTTTNTDTATREKSADLLTASAASSANTLMGITTPGDSLKASEEMPPTQTLNSEEDPSIVKRVSRNSMIRLQSIFSASSLTTESPATQPVLDASQTVPLPNVTHRPRRISVSEKIVHAGSAVFAPLQAAANGRRTSMPNFLNGTGGNVAAPRSVVDQSEGGAATGQSILDFLRSVNMENNSDSENSSNNINSSSDSENSRHSFTQHHPHHAHHQHAQAHIVRPSSAHSTRTNEHDAHNNDGEGGTLMQRNSSVHSIGEHHNNNTVSVQVPDNIFSTIEKFHIHRRRQLFLQQQKPNNHSLSSMIKDTLNVSNSHFKPGTTTDMNSLKVAPEPAASDMESGEVFRLSSNFNDIYLFQKPILYHRAVELCIMFNCLYLAFWMTNFITISSSVEQSFIVHFLTQIFMLVPVIVVMPCIGFMAKTSSLLNCISELNLDVLYAVLTEAEDAAYLLHEVKEKMLKKIRFVERNTKKSREEILKALFDEIDKDGSGEIDSLEFRLMLRALKLTYSNSRFKLLFRSMDRNADETITLEDLVILLFPTKQPEISNGTENGLSRQPSRSEVDTRKRQSSRTQNAPPINYMTESEATDLFESPEARDRKLRGISSVSFSDTDSEDLHHTASKVRVSRKTIVNGDNATNGNVSNIRGYSEIDNDVNHHFNGRQQSIQQTLDEVNRQSYDNMQSEQDSLLDMSDIVSVHQQDAEVHISNGEDEVEHKAKDT
eukprot:CAMPEP_0170113682 /NCGR_PEP_ID=MMETSP0020_2-20130122/10103_1 /TAXON_ID=98059 /ORGANISM="Dinobryon sp., Strain UTEXLB2267" /LENGTH=1358 /DNA_ID=CAMNT_0010340223 /DNA_START=228 /DNA_END=4304 /DNA_ORIENTATION=+